MQWETVQVATWMMPWWDFWHGITRALWWPAWSAVFSAMALGATIYLATSNWRRERRKDAAFIEGVAVLCDLVLLGARNVVKPPEVRADEAWDVRLKRFERYLEKAKLAQQVHDVDIGKFPTSHSLRNFMQLRAIVGALDDIANGNAVRRDKEYIISRIGGGEQFVRALMSEAREIGGRSVSATTFAHLTDSGKVDHKSAWAIIKPTVHAWDKPPEDQE